MSKDALRSRKKLERHIAKSRDNDHEVEPELRRMIDNILHFCKENNVEPETLLYHLGRLTYVGRGVLAKKHRAQFLDDDRRRSKKEVEKIQDDYRRLLETIMALSVEELKGGSVKNGESRPSINGSESEHGTAQIGSDRSYPLKGYA